MRIETLSTFPHMYDSVMGTSMMKIAQEKGALQFSAYDLRDWTHDRHRTTDDEPYGGGNGLVMKCEPIFDALDDISARYTEDFGSPTVIFLTPQGRTFDEQYAIELSLRKRLLFVCGHYEGIDERAYTRADECISLGDYVLTSGELASMVVIDAVVRRLPGVLGHDEGVVEETFHHHLLEYPQYTRPASYRGMDVPEILRSGDHKKVRQWRHEQSLLRTQKWRPDLLSDATLSNEDKEFLRRHR